MTEKEITLEQRKIILGYFELQLSFQDMNTFWDKDEAQYVHDLITTDVQKKEAIQTRRGFMVSTDEGVEFEPQEVLKLEHPKCPKTINEEY